MTQRLNNGDSVALKDYPDNNNMTWEFGEVFELDFTKGQAQVETLIDGRTTFLWVDLDNLQKL